MVALIHWIANRLDFLDVFDCWPICRHNRNAGVIELFGWIPPAVIELGYIPTGYFQPRVVFLAHQEIIAEYRPKLIPPVGICGYCYGLTITQRNLKLRQQTRTIYI